MLIDIHLSSCMLYILINKSWIHSPSSFSRDESFKTKEKGKTESLQVASFRLWPSLAATEHSAQNGHVTVPGDIPLVSASTEES